MERLNNESERKLIDFVKSKMKIDEKAYKPYWMKEDSIRRIAIETVDAQSKDNHNCQFCKRTKVLGVYHLFTGKKSKYIYHCGKVSCENKAEKMRDSFFKKNRKLKNWFSSWTRVRY